MAIAQKTRRLLQADMDITHTFIGTDAIYSGQQLPQAFRGEGVMIGITDIGFDFTHPNFNRSNFVCFWDLLSTDTIGSTLPAGREYQGSDLRSEIKHSYDGLEQTHGTHVMGIAIGGDNTYRGIAPEADIVVIGNLLSNNVEQMDSAAIERLNDFYEFDEFRYFFDRATERNQPCVVNISAGSRQTFGEDFSKWNTAISRMCGPGKIIVASAGNNGGQLTCLHKPSGVKKSGSGIYLFPINAQLFFQTSAKATFTLHATADNGTTKDAFSMTPTDASQQQDSTLIQTFQFKEKTFTTTIKEMESDYDGSTIYKISFPDSLYTKIGAELFYVSLEGEDADCTLFTHNALYEHRGKGFCDATNAYGVNIPACYDDVICVGGMTYRNEVTNKHGETDSYNNGEIGRNYTYSSVGPRLDGYQKPDVVAPGSYVVSSYSSYYAETHPDAHDLHGEVKTTEENGRSYPWVCDSGTSMSAPVVAGIIALWLQANPSLTPTDIKGIIARTARHPDSTLPYPNAIYGFGEIDAYAGLLDILGLSNIQEISHSQPQGIVFKVKNKCLELHLNSTSTGPFSVDLNISIYTKTGTKLSSVSLIAKDTVETIPLQNLPSDIYAVQIKSTDKHLCGSTLIRL